jgi:hypothetical protein
MHRTILNGERIIMAEPYPLCEARIVIITSVIKFWYFNYKTKLSASTMRLVGSI